MRVALDSLGCKLNQSEVELLAGQMAAAGYRLVAPTEPADVYILNTCTVTHIADRKSRHLLRLARRRNPAARLVVTGCYAEHAPEELRRMEGGQPCPGQRPQAGPVGGAGGGGTAPTPGRCRGF
ncbi:MAG: hypothetical protein V1691_01305 [Chloroflexota bacterium]